MRFEIRTEANLHFSYIENGFSVLHNSYSYVLPKLATINLEGESIKYPATLEDYRTVKDTLTRKQKENPRVVNKVFLNYMINRRK